MTESTLTKTRCTPRCWQAKSKKCKCSCGGDNHGVRKQPGLFGEIELPNKAATEKKPRTRIVSSKQIAANGFNLSPSAYVPQGNDCIEGYADSRKVFMFGRELEPARSQAMRNHSPDGFNWGYGGSGVAQLALAILLELMDDERAQQHYQQFKWDVLATLEQGKDFIIQMADVRKWVEAHTEIRYTEAAKA